MIFIFDNAKEAVIFSVSCKYRLDVRDGLTAK